MSKYFEQLKSPKWQKKRLEILQRDEFKCRRCGTECETLNVHHIQYITGRAPYDYPDDWLLTVCDGCHEKEHLNLGNIKDQIVKLNLIGITPDDISFLLHIYYSIAEYDKKECQNIINELTNKAVECYCKTKDNEQV